MNALIPRAAADDPAFDLAALGIAVIAIMLIRWAIIAYIGSMPRDPGEF